MTYDAEPRQDVRQIEAPPVATAVTTDTPVMRMPYAGTLVSVTYAATAAITGANTNTRKLSLINRGATGAGSTVMATLQFNAGTNAVADVELTIPNSGTAANLTFAAGDILVFESAAVGTGLADPGGLVVVTVSRTL